MVECEGWEVRWVRGRRGGRVRGRRGGRVRDRVRVESEEDLGRRQRKSERKNRIWKGVSGKREWYGLSSIKSQTNLGTTLHER
jgi:hypothetical protein